MASMTGARKASAMSGASSDMGECTASPVGKKQKTQQHRVDSDSDSRADQGPARRETRTGTSLMWFRNDLRCHDNPALRQASLYSHDIGTRTDEVATAPGTIGLFIISPDEWASHDMAPIKVDFILRQLVHLRKELAQRYHMPLCVATVDKAADVPGFVAETCAAWGVEAVFMNEEYEVDERARDEKTMSLLSDKNIHVTKYHDQCIVPPGKVFTKEGKPYSVFTPFKNSWYRAIDAERNFITPAPEPMSNPVAFLKRHGTDAAWRPLYDDDSAGNIPTTLAAFPLPPAMHANLSKIHDSWPVGEAAIEARLTTYLNERSRTYAKHRNTPALDGTSRLSAYLAAGMLSARTCMAHAVNANHGKWATGQEGLVCWMSELCWRDFYRHVLYHFPRVCKNQPFKLATKKVQWRHDADGFQAWCRGETGYPLVDAAMKQLINTGWMHNRCRMVVAMFLTKHLLVDWKKGERFFMQHLIDGDFSSNNGGWQWSASTGTDAQPYFRVFAPTTQAERFDPDGTYIKQWLPALKHCDRKAIHAPHHVLSKQAFAKLDYPAPIVDHAMARKRAIAAFEVLRPAGKPKGKK